MKHFYIIIIIIIIFINCISWKLLCCLMKSGSFFFLLFNLKVKNHTYFDIINVFTVTLGHFNESLLNKIIFLKN